MSENKPALPVAEKLTVWTKPGCVQCNAVVRELDSKGADYDYLDLVDHPDALKAFKAHGKAQAPVIQFPEVRDGDEVLFAEQVATGFRVDLLTQYREALAKVADRELIAA